MTVYLAGGISGNCHGEFLALAKAIKNGGADAERYLAGVERRGWVVDLYLAGFTRGRRLPLDMYLAGNIAGSMPKWVVKESDHLLGVEDNVIDVAILESFFYADEWTETIIPKLRRFLLDSGAFTFFSQGKHVDWDDYLTRYIHFIRKNQVERFFELDIDPLVGYKKVLEMRERLEGETGRKCIPVWHKSRGKAAFLEMCRDYDYVAIGGIVSGEIRQPDYRYFPWFIQQAHQNGAKIHGLGFTNLRGVEQYHFDSVDSTAWTCGNRFGRLYHFNGRSISSRNAPKGKRFADSNALAIHNFNEWVKFQRYAEKYL